MSDNTKDYEQFTGDADAVSENWETSAADHDPPVGGGSGGSFFLEFPVDAVVIPDAAAAESSNYYTTDYQKYDFSENIGGQMRKKNYTGVARIEVLTEKNDGQVSFDRYAFNASDKANVNLWVSGATEGPPDLIIQGGAGGAVLTRKSLQKYNGYKKSRIRYYDKSDDQLDAANSDQPDVKLRKWQVVRGEKPYEELMKGENEDNFYLYIYFAHP